MKAIFCLLLLFTVFIAGAQVCTGSLGDPIVNVTFGQGDGFGSPLPAGTTSSLSYQSEYCPVDGNYSIANHTAGCWPNDVVWHTTTDHTGNQSGYFMLINASYTPSDFYIQTVTGLCAGTTYQFAAWLLNLCSRSGGLPNITMTIEKTDGTVLSSYKTGDIPIINPATWVQYGFTFTTPSNISTVVLRMKNNAPGGVGNDVGLDDITFRPAGPAISIRATTFTGDSATLCEDNTAGITFLSSVEQCYLTNAYQWQLSKDGGSNWLDIAGATGTTFTRMPTAAGTYLYRLAVAEQNNIGISTCRVTSKAFTVIVQPANISTIFISKPEGSVCDNAPVTFSATTANGGATPTYQWQINKHAAGTNNNTFTPASLQSGDVVNCIFTSSLPCNAPLTSNSIPITILSKTSSQITKTICEGESYAGYQTGGVYTDIFKGSNGCDSTRTLTLTVNKKTETVVDTTLCYGSAYNGHNQTGTYTSTFTGINGCDSVVTLHLTVLPDINRKVWNDTLLCAGDSIVLYPGVFDNYLWQDGSNQTQFTIREGGFYSVTVSNQCGTAVKPVTVKEQICNLAFPQAFTPNGDGKNDLFKALNAYNLQSFKLIIYNRWGQMIYSSLNPAKGWDGLIMGNKAETGVYVWMCEYKLNSAAAISNLKGVVTLLR